MQTLPCSVFFFSSFIIKFVKVNHDMILSFEVRACKMSVFFSFEAPNQGSTDTVKKHHNFPIRAVNVTFRDTCKANSLTVEILYLHHPLPPLPSASMGC